MGKVMLICGKICSGKSFYAAQLKHRSRAVVLSTDEATYDLTDNAQGEGYDSFAARVNAYLMKKAAEIAEAGCDVILDWGFWSRADRAAATQYFAARGVRVQWHYIDVDDDTWRRNIEERNRRILSGGGGPDFYVDEGLLGKLLSRFEAPQRGEIDVWHRVKR